MPEVNSNVEQMYPYPAPYAQQNMQMPQQSPYGYGPQQMTVPQKTLQDEFVSQHRKNGLIERLFNGIKNLTGIGMGSKKVKKIIKKAENGEIQDEQARAAIDKYRKSQANSAQVVLDLASMAGGVMAFVQTRKQLAEDAPRAYLFRKRGVIKDEETKGTKEVLDFFSKKKKGLKLSESELAKAFKNSKNVYLRLALTGLIAGGTTKWFLGLINRIGAKEFYVDKKDYNGAVNPYDKAAYSQACKQSRRERRRADGKNFLSGMINRVTIPVMALTGGLVGVPLYFAVNSLNRYFVGNHVEEDKSFSNYFKNVKEHGFLGAALALGMGIPVALKTHNYAVFEKYSRQAVKKLENATFMKNEFDGESNVKELSRMLFQDKEIDRLVNDNSLSYTNKEKLLNRAQELVDKNFFAAKFKQISDDGTALARVLKEDCRPTRETCKKAQDYVDACFGAGEYVLDPEHYCLGVGTVAETYFAKGKDGKEVCIKVIKEGMSADKIKKDAEAFKDIIEHAVNPTTGAPLTEAEKTMYKKSIDNLEAGVLKELNLENEWKMAENLAHDTQYADVVHGLGISKNGQAYVMERAKGISLESLMNLNEAYSYRDTLVKIASGESSKSFMEMINGELGNAFIAERMKGSELEAIVNDFTYNSSRDADAAKKTIEKIDEYIAHIKSKTPAFENDIKLEPEDIKNLISEYQQVLVEQYSRVGESAKFVHGDIHPGNIFVDVDALKNMSKPNKAQELWTDLTGKVKRKNHGVFTLIDTGNVIELSKEQSISLLNLTSYIEHGNYQKIAEYVMQGVEGDALGGHTKDEATKIVADQLKACFTDTSTPLETMTTDNLLKLTSNIMKKHGIVPNDTQLNLNKAMQSADNSYNALVDGLMNGRLADFSIGEEFRGALGWGSTRRSKDGEFMIQTKKNMEKAQQQENLRNMSAEQRRHQKKMDGNMKPNQVEYHIFRLKQGLS